MEEDSYQKNTKLMAQFSQTWIIEEIVERPDCLLKKMFGGLAVYFRGRLVCVFMEDDEQTSYRGKQFDWPIWNGVLLPTEREHQPSLMAELPGTVSHPVLGKWLYLPARVASFEESARHIGELLRTSDPRVGVQPKPKKAARSKSKLKPVSHKPKKKRRRV